MVKARDKWYQIRLRNMLISMALFGIALMLLREWGVWAATEGAVRESYRGTYRDPFLLASGTFVFFGGSLGKLFGQFILGALAGLAALTIVFW